MKTPLRGVVHGKTIELEQAPGLPDGQEVGVTLEPLPAGGPGQPPAGEGLRRAFGAWAGDAEELDKFLEWNRGLGTPELDLLIGSTALVHGLTVATHNVAGYANIPGLTVVDWLIP